MAALFCPHLMDLSASLSTCLPDTPTAATTPWPQPEPADNAQAALDLLLQRITAKSDFPSLSNAVTRIQRIAAERRSMRLLEH